MWWNAETIFYIIPAYIYVRKSPKTYSIQTAPIHFPFSMTYTSFRFVKQGRFM